MHVFVQSLDGTSYGTLYAILNTSSRVKTTEIRAGAEKDPRLSRQMGTPVSLRAQKCSPW